MTSVDTSIQTDPFALARALSGKHFYAGEMRPSLSGKTFPVINPATGASWWSSAARSWPSMPTNWPG